MAAGWLLWSSFAFILSITYLFAECHTVRKLLIKTLSQVTVGVLLTIDTFQVLLLNQDINAFLGGETKVSGETLAECFWLLQALNNSGHWNVCQVEDGSRLQAQTKAIHSPVSDHSQKEDSPLTELCLSTKLNYAYLMPFHGIDLEINSLFYSLLSNLVVRLHLFNFLFAEC